MDQLTDGQRTASGRIALREVYRGPLAIAFGASIASVSGATLLYPVLPVLAADLAVDEARIGLAMAAFTAPAIVLAPLFGILADLYGRRWLLIFGLTVFGLGGGAAAFAPTYEWVLVWRAIQGIGASALLPLTIVLISDILPDDRELQGQGIKVALDRMAMIVLPPPAGRSRILSWRAGFVPFFLMLVLALAALLWMPETDGPDRDAPAVSRAHVAGAPRAAFHACIRNRLRAFLSGLRAVHLSADHRGVPVWRDAGVIGTLIAVSAVGSIITAFASDTSTAASRPSSSWCWRSSQAPSARHPRLGRAAMAGRCRDVLFGLGNGLISPLQKSLMTRRTPAELRGGVIAVDR